MNLPEGDRYSRTKAWCEARLAVLFGGREAEILLGGPDNVTNGATGDIQMATQLARSMIMEWGMSDTLGRVRYNGNEQEVFLGHSVTQTKNISDGTAKLIDEEIRGLITAGENKARTILTEKIDALHRVAKGLLEYETLSGEEVQALVRGETIVRRDDNDGSKGPASSAVPSAGRSRPREEPDAGGMAPQPQV
jgi:cell division protease FtsH